MHQNIFQNIFRYYTIEPEERTRLELNDPMCEVFPKMAACRYQRYGMGGREDNRHAICILGLNMVNDKVFIVLWIWHCFICTVGIIRILTRTRYCRVGRTLIDATLEGATIEFWSLKQLL